MLRVVLNRELENKSKSPTSFVSSEQIKLNINTAFEKKKGDYILNKFSGKKNDPTFIIN